MKKYVLKQIAMVSKWTMYGLLAQLICTGILVAEDSQAQAVKSVKDNFIKIEFKDNSLVEAFNLLEQKTGYHFAYEKAEISTVVKLTQKYGGEVAVSDILLDISKKADLKFRQINKSIIVTEKGKDHKNRDNLEIIIDDITVTGKVTSMEDGSGLPGVNVLIVGTQRGTVTDLDGNYSIVVPEGSSLQFSFIGYIDETVLVGNQSVINATLSPDLTELDEIVVTGMGIERDKKSLGYDISTVEGKDLTVAGNTVNPIVSLYGKASGVGVTTGAAGPTGAVDIKIRGAASLESSASTRPLFVVDGIPIYDAPSSMASRGYDPLNSFDYGSGINDINPEDIESMEILKGAKASVLYGGEGANGVVLITTKKGKKTRGLGVNLNIEHSWLQPRSYIDFQNDYGSGINEYDTTYTTAPDGSIVRDIIKSRYNFGPKFDNSTPIMFLDSMVRPYQAYPDNFIDIFQPGSIDNVTVAISGASEKGHMRVSYTHYDYQGLLDNFYQNKDVISFSGKMNASEFASFEINSNLYNIKTHNRLPNIGDMVAWGVNRDYDFNAIKGMYKNDDGSKFDSEGYGWPGQFAPVYLMNTLWEQYENSDTDDKFHYIGSIRATLNFTDQIYFVGQAGIDYTDTDYTTKNPITRFEPSIQGGKYSYRRNNVLVQNFRGFLNYDQTFNNFNILAFVGGEYRKDKYSDISVASYGNFNYPDYWWLDNSTDWPDWGNRGRVRGNDYGSKVSYGLMGSATLSWKDEYYLEVQGRNDWSSTLAPNNNSYFYPGLAFNWNFTNTFDIKAIDFGKFRVAWADVGRPAPGYYYAYQSYSVGSINNSDASTVNGPGSLFSGDIKPERKRELELGFDVRMLSNRLEANFSFYTNNVYDQIMGVNLSPTTGANSIKINAGNVKNWGYELFVKGSVISTPKLKWDVTATAAIQKSKVVKLYPGITSQTLGTVGSSVRVVAEEGQPFGEMQMYDYLKDNAGNRVVDQNGYYVLDKSELKNMGNVTDRVFGGLMSDLFFRGFNFHVGIDYKLGGNLFSYSNYYLLGMGITKETLQYRDEANGGLAYYVDDATGKRIKTEHNQPAPAEARDGLVYHDGMITDGVVRTGGTDENPQYSPNENILSAQEWYSQYIHDLSEDFQPDNMYKNEYVKLREMAVSYLIPQNLTRKMKVEKLEVSFVARDLFYFYKSIPNIDAESALGSNSFTEYSFFPSTPSYGVRLNLSF